MTPRSLLPPSRTWYPPTAQYDPHLALHLALLRVQGPLREQDGLSNVLCKNGGVHNWGSLENERDPEFAGSTTGSRSSTGSRTTRRAGCPMSVRLSLCVSLLPSILVTYPSLPRPARPASPSCAKPTSPPPATSPKSKPTGSPMLERSEAELASARKLRMHAFKGKVGGTEVGGTKVGGT
ncbi:hypothetical protein B0H13DRAFT_2322434 [Mycena leptocephala]|nr:hypothetical protein B0H13DRAFT_2322434 [Mycena leptocephala]